MKGLFNYDSPLMQVAGFITDLLLLNILFLICCLPIVTIGAAQSALYYAVRTLRDPEDGRSCYKLFFKGFISGFWKVTLVWCVFLVFDVILGYTMLMCYKNADLGIFIHWGVPAAGLLFSLILHSLVTVFHAQFSCGPVQLFRNSFILFVTNPFHSIVVGILTWAPAALALLRINTLLDLLPLFLLVYYSLALLVNSTIMKKPFARLIDHVNGDDIEVREDEPEMIEEEV